MENLAVFNITALSSSDITGTLLKCNYLKLKNTVIRWKNSSQVLLKDKHNFNKVQNENLELKIPHVKSQKNPAFLTKFPWLSCTFEQMLTPVT